MKCKSWSNKINNFVVRRLKSIKINGQQQQQQPQLAGAVAAAAVATTGTTAATAAAAAGGSTMPAMPKEKATAVSLSESNFSELKLKETATAGGDTAASTTSAPGTANNNNCSGRQQQTGMSATTLAWGSGANNVQMARNSGTASTCGCGAASATNDDYMPFNRYRNYVNGVLSPLAEALATATTASPVSAAALKRHAHANPHGDNRTPLNGTHNGCACDNSAANSQGGCQYTRSAAAAAMATAATAAAGAGAPDAAVAPQPARRSPNDYIFGRYIGEGSFSNVYLAVDVTAQREYAIKVCDKHHILREHKQEYIRREREVMHLMTNVPGFVSLACTFQDNRSLYFVMTYAKNGDLLPYINKVGSFDVACTRHYAAELVLACEQMHRRNVVHRDLKPENILLDENMHTLIADFGSSKMLSAEDVAAAASLNGGATTKGGGAAGRSGRQSHRRNNRTSGPAAHQRYRTAGAFGDNDDDIDEEGDDTASGGSGSGSGSASSGGSTSSHERTDENEEEDTGTGSDDVDSPSRQPRYPRRRRGSFVGTAQYVSPEVLQNGAITPAADLWALGCIVYQMISGLPPFRGSNDYVIFREILACKLDFPQGFDADAEDLVRRLLRIEPERRLGAQDAAGCYASIRAHPFFANIDFETVRECTPPPIYPYLPGVSKDEGFQAAHYCDLEPGLGDRQLTRLLGMELGTALGGTAGGITLVELNGYGKGVVGSGNVVMTSGGNVAGAGHHIRREIEKKTEAKNTYDLSEAEKQRRLKQQINDKWTFFADNEVILKRGYVNKRKGLFARKRMLLLTTGPRLIYIDPVQMIKKGEIPWSPDLRVEAKNFKIFFVHTPNRTYYLEDPEGYSLEWDKAIKAMHNLTYCTQPTLLAPPPEQSPVGAAPAAAVATTSPPTAATAKSQKSCATSFTSSSSSSSASSTASTSTSSSPPAFASSPSAMGTTLATAAGPATTAFIGGGPVAQTSLTTAAAASIRTASR